MPRRPEDVLWCDGPAAFLRSRDVSTDGRAPWLRGVALGAVGRYAEAHALLAPLGTSLSLSTLASHARQVGRHPEAAALDRRALDLADSDEARADAASGLVADALGQGDAPTATGLVAPARRAAHGWRGRTRLHWVTAELALLSEQPEDAVAEAEEALRTACAASAPRHVTKSLLVRGVARRVAGDPAGARVDLRGALTRAEEQGLPTLVWPAAAVLAELEPEVADRARTALTSIVAGLDDEGPAFAARADVAALLGRAVDPG